MRKKYDLKERLVSDENYFDNIEIARTYDLIIRTSLVVPMGRVTTKVSSACKDGQAVLDVGTGTGLLALRIAGQNENIELTAVDDNDYLLQVATENATLAAFCNAPGMVEFMYAEMHELPFEDNSFDVVYSYSALHKWKEPVKVLNEIKRVCKDDGKIYLYDLSRDTNEGIITFISQYIRTGKEDFMRELKSSYSVEEVRQILKDADMSDWKITVEDVNVLIQRE